MSERWPLVLLPGTLCDAALWAQVALPPGARPLPVVRGPSLAQAAQAVLDSVPGEQPFWLAGFSLGAIVAFEVLRRAPGRLAGLTLLSANPHPPQAQQLHTWSVLEARVRAGHFAAVADEQAAAAAPCQGAVLDMARRVGPEAYLEQLRLLCTRPDSRADLARFRGPLLLLTGLDDRVTPPALADELRALAPQATLVRVPGAGHYLPLEAPRVVSEVLGGVAYA